VALSIGHLVCCWIHKSSAEGEFLVIKFDFGGTFGMSLEGNFHEFQVTPNLELLVTFGMSLS
jgi:hypothetical protein